MTLGNEGLMGIGEAIQLHELGAFRHLSHWSTGFEQIGRAEVLTLFLDTAIQ